MKRPAFISFAILLIAVIANGQRSRTPRFTRYPASVETAQVTKIDFRRSPGASSYRTRLTEALRKGVNFAGRYILTGWGCGTGCTNGAVIDARTGVVYFPDELAGVSGYDETFEFRKNSRLLIINGSPGSRSETGNGMAAGTYFYEWKATRFRLVRSIVDKANQ